MSDNVKVWRVVSWLAVGGALWLYGTIPFEEWPYRVWDLAAYRRMAEAAPGVADGVSQPFAYRVLGPWLAGVTPGDTTLGFRLWTVVAAVGLLVGGQRFLRRMGLPESVCLLTVWFLACNRYIVGFPVWNVFQVNDLLALCAVVGLLGALRERAWRWFAVILAVGVLARETPLLMVPVALVDLWNGNADRREWTRAAGSFVPGIVVFLGVRALVPSSGGLGLHEAFARHGDKLFEGEVWLRLWLNTFLPFCFLPFVWWRSTGAFVRRRPDMVVFVGLVFLSCLFGTNHERLMAPAGLVFYVWLAERLAALRPGCMETVLLCAAAGVGSLHHLYGRWPLPDRVWTVWLSGGTTAAVTAWAVWRTMWTKTDISYS